MEFWDRYGSRNMKAIWTKKSERITWRRIWFETLVYLNDIGKITNEQLEEARKFVFKVDLDLSDQFEKLIKHDLVSELRVFQSQCPSVAEWIHKGLTSADIKDNTEILLQKRALRIILHLLNVWQILKDTK